MRSVRKKINFNISFNHKSQQIPYLYHMNPIIEHTSENNLTITHQILAVKFTGQNHKEILELSARISKEKNDLFLSGTSDFKKQKIKPGYYITIQSPLNQVNILHPKTIEAITPKTPITQ